MFKNFLAFTMIAMTASPLFAEEKQDISPMGCAIQSTTLLVDMSIWIDVAEIMGEVWDNEPSEVFGEIGEIQYTTLVALAVDKYERGEIDDGVGFINAMKEASKEVNSTPIDETSPVIIKLISIAIDIMNSEDAGDRELSNAEKNELINFIFTKHYITEGRLYMNKCAIELKRYADFIEKTPDLLRALKNERKLRVQAFKDMPPKEKALDFYEKQAAKEQ